MCCGGDRDKKWLGMSQDKLRLQICHEKFAAGHLVMAGRSRVSREARKLFYLDQSPAQNSLQTGSNNGFGCIPLFAWNAFIHDVILYLSGPSSNFKVLLFAWRKYTKGGATLCDQTEQTFFSGTTANVGQRDAAPWTRRKSAVRFTKQETYSSTVARRREKQWRGAKKRLNG